MWARRPYEKSSSNGRMNASSESLILQRDFLRDFRTLCVGLQKSPITVMFFSVLSHDLCADDQAQTINTQLSIGLSSCTWYLVSIFWVRIFKRRDSGVFPAFTSTTEELKLDHAGHYSL